MCPVKLFIHSYAGFISVVYIAVYESVANLRDSVNKSAGASGNYGFDGSR